MIGRALVEGDFEEYIDIDDGHKVDIHARNLSDATCQPRVFMHQLTSPRTVATS